MQVQSLQNIGYIGILLNTPKAIFYLLKGESRVWAFQGSDWRFPPWYGAEEAFNIGVSDPKIIQVLVSLHQSMSGTWCAIFSLNTSVVFGPR